MVGFQLPRLTIFGRSVLLISGEVVLNVAMWIIAVILFRPHASGDAGDLLSLAMLSWVSRG